MEIKTDKKYIRMHVEVDNEHEVPLDVNITIDKKYAMVKIEVNDPSRTEPVEISIDAFHDNIVHVLSVGNNHGKDEQSNNFDFGENF